MSENTTSASLWASRERAASSPKSLSFVEGVAMIVGTNIGAGVLSIAYASSKRALCRFSSGSPLSAY